MKTITLSQLLPLACALMLGSFNAHASEPSRPECIAPSKPGGGFDMT